MIQLTAGISVHVVEEDNVAAAIRTELVRRQIQFDTRKRQVRKGHVVAVATPNTKLLALIIT